MTLTAVITQFNVRKPMLVSSKGLKSHSSLCTGAEMINLMVNNTQIGVEFGSACVHKKAYDSINKCGRDPPYQTQHIGRPGRLVLGTTGKIFLI